MSPCVRQRQLEPADMFRLNREGKGTNCVRGYVDVFMRVGIRQIKPAFGLQLKLHVARFVGVVVDRDRYRDSITLGDRDGKIEVDEEVLEHLQGGRCGAECAAASGRKHGHAPRRNGVCNRKGSARVAVTVRDDFGSDEECFRKIRAGVRLRLHVRRGSVRLWLQKAAQIAPLAEARQMRPPPRSASTCY